MMDDLISRQAAIDAFDCANDLIVGGEANARNVENYINKVLGKIKDLPPAQPEIIRCKECNKASKCYGDVVMRSRGGGYIYCPLEFCSNAERREE